jgi:hypothetical protein
MHQLSLFPFRPAHSNLGSRAAREVGQDTMPARHAPQHTDTLPGLLLCHPRQCVALASNLQCAAPVDGSLYALHNLVLPTIRSTQS